MNKKVYLVTPLSKRIPQDIDSDYIGIDAGALRILEVNFPLKMAVGDFDSMSAEDFNHLQSICDIERHPIMKDETDAELGIWIAQKLGYDEIILYGALSGRIDHTYLNIYMISHLYPEVILMDDTQCVRVLKEGEYVLKNEYKNISFLPIEESVVSLDGFLYPLNQFRLKITDVHTTSNSMIDDESKVIVHSGKILCLMTNEK